MVRPCLALFFALALSAGAWAQDETRAQRDFVAGDLGDKVAIVRAAGASPGSAQLHLLALDFVSANLELFGNTEPRLLSLAAAAAEGARLSAAGDAVPRLLGLFARLDEPRLGLALLAALGELGRGYPEAAAALEAWLASRVGAYASGAAPERSATPERERLFACLDALATLGAPSAYGELFEVFSAARDSGDRELASAAATAMAALAGDYRGFLVGLLSSGTPGRRSAALAAGLDYPGLPEEARALLAERALAGALDKPGEDAVEQALVRALRFRAARELRVRRWQRASSLIVRHFYEILDAYNSERAPEAELIEAIDTLGAMGTNEAAQTLALYLQFANAETDRGGSFDEDVALAVIRSLGALGDKVAFDYLLYIGYLPWSETVKRAARDAMLLLRL